MKRRGGRETGGRGEAAEPKVAKQSKHAIDEEVKRRGERKEVSNAAASRRLVSPSPRPPVPPSTDVERRAAGVKLLLMDCDGVLTDGRITLVEGGDEQKSFHTRDGHGLVLLHRAGLRSGIISGRTSRLVVTRAADLGVAYVRQGALDKLEVFEELLAEAAVEPSEVAFVGDDVVDIPLMRRSGLAVAVADAGRDAREAAHYVTGLPGGFGAVREVCELILKSQGHWDELLKRYLV
jgi:3-deoxy-D-manno-octulosonate 8-phosphate phosphatase (KDO 8-P phosphatase)